MFPVQVKANLACFCWQTSPAQICRQKRFSGSVLLRFWGCERVECDFLLSSIAHSLTHGIINSAPVMTDWFVTYNPPVCACSRHTNLVNLFHQASWRLLLRTLEVVWDVTTLRRLRWHFSASWMFKWHSFHRCPLTEARHAHSELSSTFIIMFFFKSILFTISPLLKQSSIDFDVVSSPACATSVRFFSFILHLNGASLKDSLFNFNCPNCAPSVPGDGDLFPGAFPQIHMFIKRLCSGGENSEARLITKVPTINKERDSVGQSVLSLKVVPRLSASCVWGEWTD